MKLIVATSLCLVLLGCAKAKMGVTIYPGVPKWLAAKELSYAYFNTASRAEKLNISKKGVEIAEECIKEEPKNPACYYYHAINTGLYYEVRIVGYQEGLRTMIADCQKIIAMDQTYEYGGAYRILGLIYTEVPSSSFKAESVVKDIEKAIEYFNTAIRISPDFPENYIALAKAYIEAGNKVDAAEALIRSKELIPKWTRHEDYPFWKKDIRKLTKKLRKFTNGLQLEV